MSNFLSVGSVSHRQPQLAQTLARSGWHPCTRKSTGVAEEPLLTTHNTEGWRSCTCRGEIENMAVSGNASENVASRRADEEYLKYIVNIKFSFRDVFMFNLNRPTS